MIRISVKAAKLFIGRVTIETNQKLSMANEMKNFKYAFSHSEDFFVHYVFRTFLYLKSPETRKLM